MQKYLPAILLGALAGCTVTDPLQRETTLSDQLTDCAYAGTRYLMLSGELGLPPRISYAQAGFYKAAGEALSSKVQAESRYSLARAKYVRDMESIEGPPDPDARKRAMLETLSRNLDQCAQLASSNAHTIQPKVKEYLQHAK